MRYYVPDFLTVQEIMNTRRVRGTFMESQIDFIDYFLKKVEAEIPNTVTLYTG